MATLTSSTRSNTITLSSSTAGPFDVGFRLFRATAIEVFVNGIKQATADYTVNATFSNGYTDSATITFDSALEDGDVIIILGNMEPLRSDDYFPTDSLLTKKQNIELGQIWAAIADIRLTAKSAIRTLFEVDPVPALTPGETLIVNPAGDGWVIGTPVDVVGISSTFTLRVPTDYETVQEALNASTSYFRLGLGEVTVLIESGQAWDEDTVTIKGDFLGVTLASEDVDVLLPAGFPNDSNLIHFDRCTGLKWAIHINMDGAGSNGIFGDDAVSSIWVAINSGVSGAGGLGDASYPTGANILFWGNVYFDYDVDTQSGVKFTNAAKRNGWFSYSARVSGGKYADFSGGGTSATIAADDANGFGSRGAIIHMDNAKMGSNATRTSYKAARIARGLWSGRDMEAEDVDGNVAHIFELGIATFARANLNRCGRYVPDNTTVIVQGYEYTVTSVAASDWSSIGGPNPASEGDTFTATAPSADISALGTVNSDNYAVISIRGSTPERPQGGGWGCFESCTYDDAEYIVAEILAPNGVLDLNNSSGNGLKDKLANNSGGELLIWGVNVKASASCRADHMVQTSNNGITEGLGGVIDGNSVVDHAFRMSQGGKLYLRGYTLKNFNDSVFEFAEGGGEAFLQDLTVDGTTFFANGVKLCPGTALSTWNDAVAAIQLGWTCDDGEAFSVAGFNLAFEAGATVMPGLPGVVPATQVVEEMKLYVSADGVGDGLTAGAPCNLKTAKDYARSIIGAHRAINLTLSLAAGTYAPSTWNRFNFNDEIWAFGNSTLIIEGPAAPDGVVTATISGTSNAFMFKNDRVSPGPRVILKNVGFTGFTTYPINLKYDVQFLAINCPSDCPNGFANIRRGPAEILGAEVGTAVASGKKYRISTVSDPDWSSVRQTQTTMTTGRDYKVATVVSADWTDITGDASVSVGDIVTATADATTLSDISAYGTVYEQAEPSDVFVSTADDEDISALGSAAHLTLYSGFTDVAIVLQDCYYRVGNEKLSENETNDRGVEFDADADDPGHAIQVSRGSLRGYVVGCVFTWCDGGIQKVKGATVRTQGCAFDGFKRGAVFTDSEEGWDNDDDHLDTYRGADENHPVLRYSSGSDKHLGGRAFGKTGFQTWNGPQMAFKVTDPIWTSDITDARPYMVAAIHNGQTDWSSIGGPNPAAVGNIFTTTSAADPIYTYDDLTGESLGKAYRLLNEIDNGRVCQIADVSGSTDWSSVGGPNPASVGDFFISTAADDTDISALGYTYQQHRGLKEIDNGVAYFVAAVVSADWSAIGGSASVSVGDSFTSTASDETDISAYGVVVPVRMDLASNDDGGDTVLRPFRLPAHFFLSYKAYLEGSFSIECPTASNPTVLSCYVGNTMLWNITLPDIAGTLDRWSVDWRLHGRAPGQGRGSFQVLATELGTGTVVANVNDTDNFDASTASNVNTFLAPHLYVEQTLYTGEFRMQTLRTDGAN